MASPIDFPGTNIKLHAPSGSEDTVQSMPVFGNGNVTVSCWELSYDECVEISRCILEGKPAQIFVSVFYGKTQPPIFIGTERVVRGVVADYGPTWKKE